MICYTRYRQFAVLALGSALSSTYVAASDSQKLPSFGQTINVKRNFQKIKNAANNNKLSLDSLILISGSSHRKLSEEISALVDVPLLDATVARFADGEVSVQFNEGIRGKNAFIVQSCAAPVNDSVVELLLTVSCARRSGARRVIAVIPYFGYKHHRRSLVSSTKHHSRYLTSAAMDFAKMLQEMGVDRVIAVDLQRPGQGDEACFFDNNVPLETVMTIGLIFPRNIIMIIKCRILDHMVTYFVNNVSLEDPITVVTPNAEGARKARLFQLGLQKAFDTEVQLAVFTSRESGSGPTDTNNLEMLGKTKVCMNNNYHSRQALEVTHRLKDRML